MMKLTFDLIKQKGITLPALTLVLALAFSGCGNESPAEFSLPSEDEVGEAVVLSDSSIPGGDETAALSDSEIPDGDETAALSDSAIPGGDETAALSDSAIPGGDETAALSDSPIPGDTESAAATSPQITLLMVGDILLHTPVEKSARREDGSYSYDAIFDDTRELISSADLALVNQEVIIGGTELGISGYPAFNAPYEVGDDLVEAGFDVICHATNHALDKGKAGVLNCLNFWETNHPDIPVLGLHDSPDDALYIYEKDGMRIAFLNYTYGTNGISLPADMPYAVDLLSQQKVIDDIRLAEETADFTVVCPHWGTEYRLTPDSYQEKWTKIFLENGVDLVLGTHPHVIEPVELRTDEETGHSMLVYYSLGNFVNWTSSSGDGIANRMVGGMAQITLERTSDGSVVISDYGITALVCHLTDGQDGVTVKPLASYNEELAAENRICSQDPNFSYEYCVNLCDQVWGTLWE